MPSPCRDGGGAERVAPANRRQYRTKSLLQEIRNRLSPREKADELKMAQEAVVVNEN
jgi:hypothetical protein